MQRCPTCLDELTLDTLAEPQRTIKDCLNELNIHCIHQNRGCQKIVQLQHLKRHEATCEFAPAVCTNQGCGATLNQGNLVRHESEFCEFGKLKCHSCGVMTKTLADMEKRMTRMKRNLANMETNVATSIANMERNLATNMKRKTADTEAAIKNEVTGLKTALVEAFDQMKDVLVKAEDKTEESLRKKKRTAGGGEENIIVAGGYGIDSVEMFKWRQRTWSQLQSMPKVRYATTSLVYNYLVTISGGLFSGCVDDMIRTNIHPNSDFPMRWSECPVKLPTTLACHSSVLYHMTT